MEQIKFECEVVTPMFLGGADQQAELRPPSIRGAMRWWFRAMMGGALAGTSSDLVKEVSRKEEAIFGSTNQQSSFAISICPTAFESKPFKDLQGFFLTYLGYGLKDNNRKYIPNGSKFDVILKFNSADSMVKRLTMATYWMLSNFGNLGARATRGFGSFAVRKGFVHNLPIVDSIEKLQEGLKTIIGKDFFDFPAIARAMTDPPFSIVHPSVWKCIVSTDPNLVFNNPISLMNTVGQKLRKFRENSGSTFTKVINGKTITGCHTKDYATISSWSPPAAGAPSTAIPSQTAFGLPHQFQGSGNLRIMVEGENRPRRTSPLHIHVHKFGQSYNVSFQFFKSLFLDSGIKIQDMSKSTRHEIIAGVPSYSELDSFMSSFAPNRDIVL